MRRWQIIPAALLAATIWALGVPLAAQDATLYAREADWDVSRSEWANWSSHFEKNTRPVLEKLLAAGVIVEWWFSTASLHSEDGYTHTTGYSATSLASLQQALGALVESDRNQSEDERRAFAAAVEKHRDRLLRSVVYRARATSIDGGYFVGSTNEVERGQDAEFREWWKQHIHQTSGSATGWYAVANAEGLDEVSAAFAAAFGERTADERSAMFEILRNITAGHTDSLSKIIHYSAKEGSY